MQHTLGMLQEQQFKVVCSAKHAHYLLGADDEVSGDHSDRYLIEIKDVLSKKLELHIF